MSLSHRRVFSPEHVAKRALFLLVRFCWRMVCGLGEISSLLYSDTRGGDFGRFVRRQALPEPGWALLILSPFRCFCGRLHSCPLQKPVFKQDILCANKLASFPILFYENITIVCRTAFAASFSASGVHWCILGL